MRKNAWFVTLIVAISFMLCFAGCKQAVSPESPIENPSNEVVAELKPIGFKVALPAKNRAYYTQDDASKYVVELVMNGSIVETQNGTPGQTLTFTVKNEGTYTINVSAYNDENTLIADGSASKAITFADGYVSVVIKLRPKQIEGGVTDPSDPSNPSVENKVDIGIDIQWVLPEERILTLENTGNSNFTRMSNGINLGKSLVLEFTSGMQLYDIFRENDVNFWPDSYEMNGKMYACQGYYVDAEGNEYYEGSMLTEDITLSPEFRVVPKVTFNLNGGTYNGQTDDIVRFTNWLDDCFIYPTKDNLTFVGWTFTPDGEDFVTDIEEDITVYAKYIEPKPCTLTVTTNEYSYFYNYNSGENIGTSVTLEFTSGMTLEEIFNAHYIEYWLNDYYLDGREYEMDYYLDANNNEYNRNSVILDNLELTAKFLRVPNITFNLNGGNVDGEPYDIVTSIYNEFMLMPVKDGYVIYAWTLTLDGDDYLVSADGVCLNYDLMEWVYEDVFEKGEDLTLYASWKEPEICTLTLTAPADSNFTSISTGENLGTSLTLEFTNGVTLGEIFIANDVNFRPEPYFDSEGDFYDSNWSYERYIPSEGYTRTYWENDIILSSLELTPVFNRMPLVTFNLNGGNIDGDTSDVMVYTNYFSINYNPVVQPTRDGFILIGWTLTPDGDDIVESADSNITVYARWADALQLFESGDIVGEFSAEGLPLAYEGEGIYTAEFIYAEDMNTWGSDLGTIAFKLRPTAGDWATSYGMITEPTVNGEEGQLSLSSSSNIVVSGLEVDITYRVTVRCTETGEVFVAVSTVE